MILLFGARNEPCRHGPPEGGPGPGGVGGRRHARHEEEVGPPSRPRPAARLRTVRRRSRARGALCLPPATRRALPSLRTRECLEARTPYAYHSVSQNTLMLSSTTADARTGNTLKRTHPKYQHTNTRPKRSHVEVLQQFKPRAPCSVQ